MSQEFGKFFEKKEKLKILTNGPKEKVLIFTLRKNKAINHASGRTKIKRIATITVHGRTIVSGTLREKKVNSSSGGRSLKSNKNSFVPPTRVQPVRNINSTSSTIADQQLRKEKSLREQAEKKLKEANQKIDRMFKEYKEWRKKREEEDEKRVQEKLELEKKFQKQIDQLKAMMEKQTNLQQVLASQSTSSSPPGASAPAAEYFQTGLEETELNL